jgi:hypothetical protein
MRTITPRELIGLSTTAVSNYFGRQWLLFLARNADINAAVENQKARQAMADASTFQKRAALCRSKALQYK